MRYRKYRKNGEQRFVKYLVRIIIALIILMLILVVHDRYVFHKQVYDIAISEVNAQKKAYADSIALDSINKRGLFTDTVSKPVQFSSSSSDAQNHNEISQTINISNPDYIKQITEDATSIIDKLKDTDGLISANGITYLISLIVALLIALVSDRVIDMENKMMEMYNLKNKLMKYDKEMPMITELENETQRKLQQVMSFYDHTTNYNNILNRIQSLYNHSIIIDNTLSSAGISEKTPELVGLLCSRINRIYDDIIPRFNDNKHRLDFITSDEKYLLETYIEDAFHCLKETLNMVNKNDKNDKNNTIHRIIEDKIYLIEEIRGKIDTIEIRENIYKS